MDLGNKRYAKYLVLEEKVHWQQIFGLIKMLWWKLRTLTWVFPIVLTRPFHASSPTNSGVVHQLCIGGWRNTHINLLQWLRILGYRNLEMYQRIQQNALRFYWGVHPKNPLLPLEGDIGWIHTEMISFWNLKNGWI